MVCYDRTIFGWDTTFWKSGTCGCKIAFTVVRIKSLAMHVTNQKIKFWYIYGRKCTKYIHGTWSLLNTLMIVGIKEKSIILTYAMYCWLLLLIYLCYFWLVLWSRVTNVQCDACLFSSESCLSQPSDQSVHEVVTYKPSTLPGTDHISCIRIFFEDSPH